MKYFKPFVLILMIMAYSYLNRTTSEASYRGLENWSVAHLIWNSGPRVWRKNGEAQNPSCLKSSVKFPQSVMIWGAMSFTGVGPLYFIKSKENTAVYKEVLQHFMHHHPHWQKYQYLVE